MVMVDGHVHNSAVAYLVKIQQNGLNAKSDKFKNSVVIGGIVLILRYYFL